MKSSKGTSSPRKDGGMLYRAFRRRLFKVQLEGLQLKYSRFWKRDKMGGYGALVTLFGESEVYWAKRPVSWGLVAIIGQCGLFKRDKEGQSEVDAKYKRCGRGTVARDSDGRYVRRTSQVSQFHHFHFFFFLVVGLYICPARKQGLLQDRNGFYFISPVYVWRLN